MPQAIETELTEGGRPVIWSRLADQVSDPLTVPHRIDAHLFRRLP